jgi:uncharacterized protein YlzI (FlbEa/FlbD family)
MTEQRKFWGAQAAFFGAVAAVAMSIITVMTGNMPNVIRDQFPIAVPQKCEDFTPYTLNRVLENSPLIKLTGVKVLEVTKARDTSFVPNAAWINKLRCDLNVMLSSGADMVLRASTEEVNKTVYIRAEFVI